MSRVSAEERASWLAEPSAAQMRDDIEDTLKMARGELQGRALQSSDPGVRAAAERIQTLTELLGRLTHA